MFPLFKWTLIPNRMSSKSVIDRAPVTSTRLNVYTLFISIFLHEFGVIPLWRRPLWRVGYGACQIGAGPLWHRSSFAHSTMASRPLIPNRMSSKSVIDRAPVTSTRLNVYTLFISIFLHEFGVIPLWRRPLWRVGYGACQIGAGPLWHRSSFAHSTMAQFRIGACRCGAVPVWRRFAVMSWRNSTLFLYGRVHLV